MIIHHGNPVAVLVTACLTVVVVFFVAFVDTVLFAPELFIVFDDVVFVVTFDWVFVFWLVVVVGSDVVGDVEGVGTCMLTVETVVGGNPPLPPPGTVVVDVEGADTVNAIGLLYATAFTESITLTP